MTISRETHWSCCSSGTLCVLLCPLKLPLSNCLIPEATGGLADKPQCSKITQGEAGDMDPALPESQLESGNCCNTLTSCLIPTVQVLACRMGSGTCHGHFQGPAFYVSLNHYLFLLKCVLFAFSLLHKEFVLKDSFGAAGWLCQLSTCLWLRS